MGKHTLSYVLIIVGVLIVAAAILNVASVQGLRGALLGVVVILAGLIFYRRGK
jgi:uncharacterized membrane protein